MKGLTGKRWWSALLLAAAVVVMCKLVNNVEVLWGWLGKLFAVLAPFIGGALLAFLLYRPSAALERVLKKSRFRVLNRPARAWAVLAVYLGLLGVLGVAVAVVLPLAIQGVSGLIEVLPTYILQAKTFVETLGQENGQHAEWMELFNLSEAFQGAFDFVKRYLTVENILGYLTGLLSITSSFVNVLLAVIVSVYMLAGRESLLATIDRLGRAFLPEKAVFLIGHYGVKAADIFSRYVYSMLLDALCVCVLLIPGMYISGIPFPLAFAAFIGVANLVPYFGAIVGGVLAVVVVLLSGHWGMALFLAVYIIVMQQLDSNLLQPRIYGQSVGLKPLYVLLAVTAGGGLGGFVGILIGVPATAVLQILVNDFILHRARVKRDRAAALAAAQTAAEREQSPAE